MIKIFIIIHLICRVFNRAHVFYGATNKTKLITEQETGAIPNKGTSASQKKILLRSLACILESQNINYDKNLGPRRRTKVSQSIRLVQDFIIPALNQETYGDLLKWDSKPAVFMIKWMHKARSSWTEEDS